MIELGVKRLLEYRCDWPTLLAFAFHWPFSPEKLFPVGSVGDSKAGELGERLDPYRVTVKVKELFREVVIQSLINGRAANFSETICQASRIR